jgi:hypothetical protein
MIIFRGWTGEGMRAERKSGTKVSGALTFWITSAGLPGCTSPRERRETRAPEVAPVDRGKSLEARRETTLVAFPTPAHPGHVADDLTASTLLGIEVRASV